MSNKRIYKTGTPIKNMFDGDQVLRIPVRVEEHLDGHTNYARFEAIIRSADIPETEVERRVFFEKEIKRGFQRRVSALPAFFLEDIENIEFSEPLPG